MAWLPPEEELEQGASILWTPPVEELEQPPILNEQSGWTPPINELEPETTVEPVIEPTDAITPVSSINDQFDSTIGQYSKEFNVSSNLIKGLIQQESGFKTGAESPVGAKGLGQFMPGTGARYGLLSDKDFFDSDKNIKATANFLNNLMSYYEKKGVKGDDIVKLALGAYNGGHRKARYDLYKKYGSSWVEHLNEIKTKNKNYDFKQNRGYIDTVYNNFLDYNKTNIKEEVIEEEITEEDKLKEAIQYDTLPSQPDLTAIQDKTFVPVEIDEPVKEELTSVDRAIIQKVASTFVTASKDWAANAITAFTSIGDKPTSAEDVAILEERNLKESMVQNRAGYTGFGPRKDEGNVSAKVLNDLAKKLRESTPEGIREEIAETSKGKLFTPDIEGMITSWSTMLAQQAPNLIAAGTLTPAGAFLGMSAQEKEGFKSTVKTALDNAGVKYDEGALNEMSENVGIINGTIEYIQNVIAMLPLKKLPKKLRDKIVGDTAKKLSSKMPKKFGFIKELGLVGTEGLEEVGQGGYSRKKAIEFIESLDISEEQRSRALKGLGAPQVFKEFVSGAGIAAITRGVGKAASNAITTEQKPAEVITEEKRKVEEDKILAEKIQSDFKKDNEKQLKEIKLHAKHLSNLEGREVPLDEAAKDWTSKHPDERETLAQLYRDKRNGEKIEATLESIREERLTKEERAIVSPKPISKKPAEVAQKVSEKPAKVIKDIKVTDKSIEKKEEQEEVSKGVIEISKADKKKFTSLVGASDNVKMNSKALNQGVFKVEATIGNIKKVIVLAPEDIKNPRVFRAAIQKAFSVEEIESLTEGDIRVGKKAMAEVKELLADKPIKSKTDKDRLRIEALTVEGMKVKLSKDLRLKDKIENFTDSDIKVLQEIVADHGISSLSVLNNETINRIFGGDVTSREKSDIKAAELRTFDNPAVPVYYSESSDQAKSWLSATVLRPSVKIKVPSKVLGASEQFKNYMSKKVDKRNFTAFTDLVSEGEIKRLTDSGAIEVTLIPNNVPTQWAKEGPYTDRLKTLTEGATITAKTVSLDDMKAEKGIFEGSLEGEDTMEKGSSTIKYDVGTVDPDVSSSFGSFLDKRVGPKKQAVTFSEGERVQGVLVPVEAVPDVVIKAMGLSEGYRKSGLKLSFETAIRETRSGRNIHTFFIRVASGRITDIDLSKYSKKDVLEIIESQRILERYLEYVEPVDSRKDKKEYEENFKQQVNTLTWNTTDNALIQSSRDIMFAISDSLKEMQVELKTNGSEAYSAYFTATRIIRMTQNHRFVSSFAHEAGHYYFHNLLTADERANYSKEFVDRFANEKEVVESLPFPDMAGTNLGYSPSEYFAEAFSQSLLQDKALNSTTKLQENLFQLALKWARYLFSNIIKRVQVDPIAKKYIDLSLSRKYENMEHLAGYFRPAYNNVPVFSEMEFSQDDGIEWNVLEKKENRPKPDKSNKRKIMENALLADSVNKLTNAKTVKEAQNHFIDFVVYKMPIGPVRKNMLKTVASIKAIEDKSYIHAMEVVERYTELKNKTALINEIKKLLNPKSLNKMNQEGREAIDKLMEKYSTKRLTAKKRLELIDLTSELSNEDPNIASPSEVLKIKREQIRLTQEPLAYLDSEKLTEIRDRIEQEVISDWENKKAIKAGRRAEVQESTAEVLDKIRELGSEESAQLRTATGEINKKVQRLSSRTTKRSVEFFMSPETIANIMDGSEDGPIYRNVIEPIQLGQKEGTKFEQVSSDIMKDLVRQTGVDTTNWSYTQESGIANLDYVNEVKKDTFKLKEGNSITLSKAEQVSLLRMSRDEGGINHLLGGGVVIGKSVTPIELDIDDITMMVNTIDEDVFKVARAFDSYYKTEANYLNAFTRRTRGTEIAKNKHYHPLLVQGIDRIKTDYDFNSTEEIYNRVNRRSLTPGTVKERQENAKNAVFLEDIFVARTRTAADAGFFVGMSTAIPQVKNVLHSVEQGMKVKDLDQEYGIFNKWLDRIGEGDINAKFSPPAAKVYNIMRKLFTAGVLGYKNTVILFQEISAFNYITLLDDPAVKAEISSKIPGFVAQSNIEHFRNIGNNKETTDKEMMEHSVDIRNRIEAMAIDRDINDTSNEVKARKDTQDLAIGRKKSRKVKGAIRVETGFKPIGFMDTIAIYAIWLTAKYEIGITTDLVENSPAYWNAVTKRAEEVIRKTQPTFNSLDKSEILNLPLLKEFTMFSSQRSKLANMTIKAVAKVQRGDTANGLSDLVYIAVAIPAMLTAIRRVFSDKEYEDLDESVKEFLSDMVDSFVSTFSVIGEAVGSIIKGRRGDTGGVIAGNLENITNFYQATQSDTWKEKKTFRKRMKARDKKMESVEKHGLRLLQSFGINAPVFKDIYKTGEEIITGEDRDE